MDRKTREEGNRRNLALAKIVVAAFCLFLMLFSLALVSINSYAATARQVTKNPSIPPSDTTPPIPSPSVTIIPSPTQIPTPKPTPKPTPRPTPKPTPWPTPQPTAIPTTAATATPARTAGATPTATAKATATANAMTTPTSTDQTPTPTPLSGAPTTTTNNSNGNGGGNNNTPSNPPAGSILGQLIHTIVMSLLVLSGLAAAVLVSLIVIRKRLLPSPAIQASLPPSGAQPWRRVRSGNLNGTTAVQGDWNNRPSKVGYAGALPESRTHAPGSPPVMAPNQGYTMANNSAYPPVATGPFPNNPYGPAPISPNAAALQNNNIAFSQPTVVDQQVHPYMPPPSTNAFSQPAAGAPPNTNAFSPPITSDRQSRPYMPSPDKNGPSQVNTADQRPSPTVFPTQDQKTVSNLLTAANIGNNDPVTEQVKPSGRQISRPIRLKNIQNSGPFRAINNPTPLDHEKERVSEELPSLNGPFLRDTLKQYIQRDNK